MSQWVHITFFLHAQQCAIYYGGEDAVFECVRVIYTKHTYTKQTKIFYKTLYKANKEQYKATGIQVTYYVVVIVSTGGIQRKEKTLQFVWTGRHCEDNVILALKTEGNLVWWRGKLPTGTMVNL